MIDVNELQKMVRNYEWLLEYILEHRDNIGDNLLINHAKNLKHELDRRMVFLFEQERG